MNFGTTEIILIIVAILLLFGASRLPQLAKSIGQSRKAFKEGMREAEEEDAARTQIKSGQSPSGVSSMTDEEILAEMQRRSESKS
jgi:sec-independent protein translocase protein TatA